MEIKIKNLQITVITFLTLFAMFPIAPLLAWSEETETIYLETSSELVSATAYILKEGSVVQHKSVSDSTSSSIDFSNALAEAREAKLKRKDKDTWAITVTLIPSDRQTGNKLSVIAEDENGKKIPARVQLLYEDKISFKPAETCIDTEDVKTTESLVALDEASLKTLIDIRNTRNTVLEIELKRLLNNRVLKRLNILESELGLANGKLPISKDTPLPELARRVGFISALHQQ